MHGLLQVEPAQQQPDFLQELTHAPLLMRTDVHSHIQLRSLTQAHQLHQLFLPQTFSASVEITALQLQLQQAEQVRTRTHGLLQAEQTQRLQD
jgi:hypothetical protein